MDLADLADEVLTSSFERGSSPVVGSSSSSRTAGVRSARASATFCCIPRERFSIGSPRRSAGKPTRSRICGISSRVSAGGHPVEPRRVGEVLGRRHLLEEGRLDRDPVDEPANGAGLLEDVVAEDVRAAAVVQEQRREQPDERRLPRAVLAEDRDALAAGDLEGDALAAPRRARGGGAGRSASRCCGRNSLRKLWTSTACTCCSRLDLKGHGTGAPPVVGRCARRTGISRGATSRRSG